MINLPSVLTEDTHFYQEHKEKLQPYLGRPYISYSSVSSWFDYKDDFIKQKFAGIKLPDGIYALMGNYVGEAIEHGYFAENNPNGFEGQENLDFSRYRKEGAEYEKLIVIDMGDYIIVGFIDIFYVENETVNVEDMKSGGNICLGPVHNMGQLIPVLNLLVLHLLHRCAGDDQSVKVLVFYIVKGLIELI